MNKAIATRELQVMDSLQLESVKNQLSNLMQDNPKKIEAFKTRMLKISLSYGLDKCTTESIINCGLQAITLDLPLEAGQGYIVNYGGSAQFDAGYKGWQVLAKRAGYSTEADTVYKCDEFSRSGFGFDREMIFHPSDSQRNIADDKWARENLVGVIVSIMEDSTNNTTVAFVDAEMIHKIVGMSPSMGSDKARKYSPHMNWADQMFCAKAIKQVLSKFPIDISKASQLHQALEIVNVTETAAQSNAAPAGLPLYPKESFDENFPKWLKLVESGQKKAMTIVTRLSNGYSLSQSQLETALTLKDAEPKEPINGETVVEPVAKAPAAEAQAEPEVTEKPPATPDKPLPTEQSPEAAEFFKEADKKVEAEQKNA